jgi:hypothetical protein
MTGLCLWTARLVFLAAGYYLQLADVRRHHLEASFFGLIVFGLGFVALGQIGQLWARPQASLPPLRTSWPAAVGAVLAGIALYYPFLGTGFLSDDYVLWSRALANDFVSPASEFFRPLPLMLWRTAAFSGTEPAFALHAVNLLLHTANTFLLFCLARALGFSESQAGLSAAIFLVWPTGVEAIAWCSGIQDVLMTTCLLAGMTAPLWTLSRPAAGAVFFLLMMAAVASKETAVAAPVLFGVWWLGRFRRAWTFIGLAAAAGSVAIVVRLWLGLPGGYLAPPGRYVLKELVSRLGSGLAMPITGATLERVPHVGVTAVIAVAVLTAFASVRWSTDRPGFERAARGALWAFVSILPVYRYFFIGPDLDGSRYLYLASVGWAVLLVQLVFSAFGRAKRLATTMAVLVIVAGAGYSRQQLDRWQAAATLRHDVLLSAREAVVGSDCTTASFERLPDSVRGVYVFRNGFYEAIAIEEETAPVRSRIRPDGACLFVWQDGSFERVRRP